MMHALTGQHRPANAPRGNRMASRSRAALAVLLAGSCLAAAPTWATSSPRFTAKVDARGYIDVWRLRHDVAIVEDHQVDDKPRADTGFCEYPTTTNVEADICTHPDYASNTDAEAYCAHLNNTNQAPHNQRTEKICVAKRRHQAAVYRQMYAAFNAAWLPAIRNAVAHGDLVAEVILRQCSTTTALDRHGEASTCNADPAQRAIADERLHAIGFVPALAFSPNVQRQPAYGKQAHGKRPHRKRAANRLESQQQVLAAMRQGALGFDPMLVLGGIGNGARNADDLQVYRNYALIEAVVQDAPIAFTVTPESWSAGWKTSEFAVLKLNRQPLTPGFLTWGRRMYFAGGGLPYTGPHYWCTSPIKVVMPSNATLAKMAAGMTEAQIQRTPAGESFQEITVAGPDDGQFRRELYDTLATISTTVDAYLKQDPRWAVFLLHRVGLHEWVPGGMRSTTARLDRAWLGRWKLESRTPDWNQPMQPASGYARISRDRSGDFHMTVHATPAADAVAPFANVDDCTLRYSGGMTYAAQPQHAGEEITAFGTLTGKHAREALAPLDPKLRYKQVLMQCVGAESPYSDDVRFLLLAGDHLLEIGEIGADETQRIPHIAVRQYRRVR